MKIIDEKGRLLGRINVIDFLALFLAVSMLLIFYSGYRTLSKKKTAQEKPQEYVQIELRCKFLKVGPEMFELIAVGDKEIGLDGELMAEIAWIGESRAYQHKISIDSNNSWIYEDRKYKELDIVLNVRARLGIGEASLFFKDKQITYNSAIEFSTPKYTLNVLPVSILNDAIRSPEHIDLNIVFKDLSDDAAKLIAIGDKEVDGKGEVIAEVLDIARVSNNMIEIDLGNNNTVVGEDIGRKQVNVKMRLKGSIGENNKFFFNGGYLQHNMPIEFRTEKYALRGIVGRPFFKEAWLQLKLKFTDVSPELAKLVAEGDVDKNLEGEIRGRIKRIVEYKSPEMMPEAPKGNKYIEVSDSQLKDVVVIVELRCEEVDGILYYREYPVKLGNSIIFNNKLYTLSGTILQILGRM